MLQRFLALPIHIRIAILIAPILFVLGWGSADYFYSSRQSTPSIRYVPLSLNQPCALSNATCEWQLSADDLTVSLRQATTSQVDLVKLVLNTEQYIKGIELRLLDANGQENTVIMQQVNQESNEWVGAFPQRLLTSPAMTLRLVMVRTGEIFHFSGEIQF